MNRLQDVSDDGSAPTGPLQEWLRRCREARPRERQVLKPGVVVPVPRQGEGSKRSFLVEFECLGDVKRACDASGCTPSEIRHWRAIDMMFRRDFALAAMAHVRDLKRIVEALAGDPDEARAELAREVLAREAEYLDADRRLDVRAWRDVLWEFVRRLGIDPASWEPEAGSSIS